MAGVWTFMFSALRFDTGADYFSYVSDIESGEIGRYEPISWLLMRFAGEASPQLFFVVTSAVIIGFSTATILHAEKQANISRLAFLAFVCLPAAYLESLGYVRQFCATSILIYAFVRRDNKPLAIVMVVLATGFHAASLAYAPILIAVSLWKWRIPSLVYAALLAISFFGSEALRFASEMTGFYSHYFTNNTTTFGRNAMLLYVAIFLVVLVYRRGAVDGKLDKELNVFFVGVCLYAALSPYGGSLARGAWFAVGIAPVLIGAVTAKSAEIGRIASLGILAGLFGYQVHLAMINPIRDFLGGYKPYVLTTPDERAAALRSWDKAVNPDPQKALETWELRTEDNWPRVFYLKVCSEQQDCPPRNE